MRSVEDILKNTKPVPFDTDKLVPYENNVKKHPPEQVDGIAKSIERFGWNGSPIVIDDQNVIINGHGRRLAALKLGLKQVPVVILKGLTEEEKKSLRIADNKTAVSDYDTDALQKEIESISIVTDVDSLLGGILSDKELDFMVADLGEMDDSVFRTDLDTVADEMKERVQQKIEEAEGKSIGVTSVLGFKTVNMKYASVIERFIQAIKGDSEDAGEAFGEFCAKYVGD